MLYGVLHRVLPPVIKAVWRPTVRGIENIPLTGPVILASNHLSFVDSIGIPAVAPREVVFLTKDSYFTGTGIGGWVSRTFFETMGMLPVDRSDSRAAMTSLTIAADVLRQGKAFGIYPEGTRSHDGRLYRGRTGMAHLALSVGVPVVPVAVRGTEAVMPVDSGRIHLARVQIEFGRPIQARGRFEGVPLGRARREFTDEVMAAIAAMSGQERAAEYNERADV